MKPTPPLASKRFPPKRGGLTDNAPKTGRIPLRLPLCRLRAAPLRLRGLRRRRPLAAQSVLPLTLSSYRHWPLSIAPLDWNGRPNPDSYTIIYAPDQVVAAAQVHKIKAGIKVDLVNPLVPDMYKKTNNEVAGVH